LERAVPEVDLVSPDAIACMELELVADELGKVLVEDGDIPVFGREPESVNANGLVALLGGGDGAWRAVEAPRFFPKGLGILLSMPPKGLQ